jgi:hypothetical protein
MKKYHVEARMNSGTTYTATVLANSPEEVEASIRAAAPAGDLFVLVETVAAHKKRLEGEKLARLGAQVSHLVGLGAAPAPVKHVGNFGGAQ